MERDGEPFISCEGPSYFQISLPLLLSSAMRAWFSSAVMYTTPSAYAPWLSISPPAA